MSEIDFVKARAFMVSNQLRPSKVTDAVVLATMAEVPRERFVPAESAGVAYRDTIVPLGGGRGLNPPLAVGGMLDALQPKKGEKALVIGASTGYSAALLAEMGCIVTALEEDAALAAKAREALAGFPSVTLVEGPLTAGWPAGAPYDLILIDGLVTVLPDAIPEQLVNDGRLACAIEDRGVSRLATGRRAPHGFGLTSFFDIETAPLPGFQPAPAFTF